jgi:hypothetical protein
MYLVMMTRTAAAFNAADKDSSCILGEEWLLLLVENVQLHSFMLINTKEFLYCLVFLC